MCKLMTFTDSSKIKSLKRVVNVVLPLITKNDDDGFGWIAYGSNGTFGERMTEMHHGYRLDRNGHSVKLPIVDKTYEALGQESNAVGALLLHGRTSTNHKSLINTHPIARNAWTLVHNGVVGNRGPEYEQLTTNDTEHLVHYLSTEGIDGVERHLSGYYAFAAIDPRGLTHICRDSNASLYVAWIRSIESYCFATTEELIRETCKQLKWKCGPVELVESNVYMVMQGNEMLERRTITPRGYDSREASLMSTSLHYRDDMPMPEGYSQVVEEARDMATRDAIDLFLDECLEVDDTYDIYDYDDEPMSAHVFRKLDDMSKLECSIYRPDGTLLSLEAIEREEAS